MSGGVKTVPPSVFSLFQVAGALMGRSDCTAGSIGVAVRHAASKRARGTFIMGAPRAPSAGPNSALYQDLAGRAENSARSVTPPRSCRIYYNWVEIGTPVSITGRWNRDWGTSSLTVAPLSVSVAEPL